MKNKTKVWGTKSNPRFKITIGRWYLEVGKVLATYRTPKELIAGIKTFTKIKK
jgi:hypothetical protein